MSEESELLALETKVTALLAKKDKVNALLISLQNPPINSKSEKIKDGHLALVEQVISTVTESEIEGLIKNMDLDTCDILMKYIYRLMAKASNCSVVLKLHAEVVNKAGLSCIVKAITERNKV